MGDGNDIEGAAAFVPRTGGLRALAHAAAECTGCDLYREATQVVFGEGATGAVLCLVGEQPGDQEDRKGHPFVGPAGGVLWRCVDAAGIDRGDVYTTNAVKHFKHERRGVRRIHKRPTTAEVEACHPWIAAELSRLRARAVVALGAVAARSLLGRSVTIAAARNEEFEVAGRPLVVTYHPSAVLRADERASEIRQALIADLQRAARLAVAGA